MFWRFLSSKSRHHPRKIGAPNIFIAKEVSKINFEHFILQHEDYKFLLLEIVR
jgi:hypothetical protein